MLSKLSRKQRIRNLSIGFAVVISLFLFTRTDAFARVLIAAYQQVVGETVEENDTATVRFLAGQLNNIDNLEDLGADQALIESIEEVNELNIELDLNVTDSLTQNAEDFNASLTEESTTTTVAPSTTTTTVAPSTTTTTVAQNAPVYGTPTIYRVVIDGGTITAFFNDATTNTGQNIVGHGCEYSTISGGASGGTSTSSYSSFCSLDFPIMYEAVSIKVKQQFPGAVSCGEGCYTDNWTEWSNEVSIDLSGNGTINDSSVEFVWNRPEPGPDCYPTYPKNKQVNNLFLPFNESEMRQSLLDYGNYYGRLCGDELVNAYINHWKNTTADDIANLYPSWSEAKLDLYLNGSGNYQGWYGEWNSTPLTTTTTTTTTTTVPVTVTASTSSELVGCLNNSQIGESAVRLWITNTTNTTAYFDVRYSTDSGSSWTDLSDGEEVTSSAAYMFLTPNLPNYTEVQWQWRGEVTNPSSGNYNSGPSITIPNCPNANTPPLVSNVSFTTSVDVSNGSQNVSISADFEGIPNSLEVLNFKLRGVDSSGSEILYYSGCNVFYIVDMPTASHSCTYSIPDTLPAQTMDWIVYARDVNSNVTELTVGSLTVANN